MNTQRGFTILELMMGVALMGIILTIGVPSFTTLMANNRLTSQVNQLTSSLQLARSEAIKFNQRVVVCPSTNGTSCATGAAFPDDDWSIGWLTFIDRNRDGDVDDDGAGNPADDPCSTTAGDDAADDCIISYVAALTPDAMTLIGNTTNDFIFYSGLGASNEAATFILCDDRGASHARVAMVANTGRVSVHTKQLDGISPFTDCDFP